MTPPANIDAAALRDWLDEADFSGVVHIARNDDPPLTIARGFADRAGRITNGPETRFGTASTTKLMTGLAVARLVDRGTLSYDSRLVDVLPAVVRPTHLGDAVTIGHLLSHTSGVADYIDELEGPPYETLWEAVPPGHVKAARDLVPLFRDLAPWASPGVEVRYNNAAFVLAGLAIEATTGERYPEIVAREVFGPLGMSRSGFWPLDGVEPDLAVGYLPPDPDGVLGVPRETWQTNAHALPVMGQPDGGAQSTATDLVRLLDGLTGRGDVGSRYLRPATRSLMLGPHAMDPRNGARYGYGVVHAGDGDAARLGHGGDDPGFACRAYAFPALGLRVVVLSNVTEGAAATFRHIDARVGTSSELANR